MDIPEEFLPVMLAQMALFVGLWVVLKRVWFDPALKVIAAREMRSHGAVAEARRLQDEAARMRREHGAATEQAKAEAQKEVQEMLRQAETEQRQLIARANEDAQRTLNAVREDVARDVDEARQRLQADVRVIANEVAKAVIGRAV